MAARCPGVGARVRVLDSHRTAERRGMTGTVEKLWGDPSCPAVDVVLDDGGPRLFWHHELEEVAPASPPSAALAAPEGRRTVNGEGPPLPRFDRRLGRVGPRPLRAAPPGRRLRGRLRRP